MVLAELLKRPIGDKRVHDSQSASRNPGLYLGHGYAKKVCCPFPGICVIPICQGSRDSFNGGGVKRCTNLVAVRYGRAAVQLYRSEKYSPRCKLASGVSSDNRDPAEASRQISTTIILRLT